MIYWYQNLYMDEAVEKNPKRCKKRVEKRRPWKKSYVVLTLAQNDKNLFEIMQTRQLFFRRYRHVDMYVVALTSDYDAAVEILQQILEKKDIVRIRNITQGTYLPRRSFLSG